MPGATCVAYAAGVSKTFGRCYIVALFSFCHLHCVIVLLSAGITVGPNRELQVLVVLGTCSVC